MAEVSAELTAFTADFASKMITDNIYGTNIPRGEITMGSKFDRIKDYITGFKSERERLIKDNANLDGKVMRLKTKIESMEASHVQVQQWQADKISELETQLDGLVALIDDLDEPEPESEEEEADRIRQEEEVGEVMYEKGLASLTPPSMKKAAANKTNKSK